MIHAPDTAIITFILVVKFSNFFILKAPLYFIIKYFTTLIYLFSIYRIQFLSLLYPFPINNRVFFWVDLLAIKTSCLLIVLIFPYILEYPTIISTSTSSSLTN